MPTWRGGNPEEDYSGYRNIQLTSILCLETSWLDPQDKAGCVPTSSSGSTTPWFWNLDSTFPTFAPAWDVSPEEPLANYEYSVVLAEEDNPWSTMPGQSDNGWHHGERSKVVKAGTHLLHARPQSVQVHIVWWAIIRHPLQGQTQEEMEGCCLGRNKGFWNWSWLVFSYTVQIQLETDNPERRRAARSCSNREGCWAEAKETCQTTATPIVTSNGDLMMMTTHHLIKMWH